tara:strand:+ start:1312 stop:2238 length:927 start_codon:yes stop_codon:yes gene_type:complete
MRLYEERNKKPNMTCGYCHESGHSRNNCPTLKAHYEQDQRGEPVDASLLTELTKYWGVGSSQLERWYERYGKDDAERYFGEKTKKTNTKPRKKAKCGFCGKRGHNRRNCKAMKQFKYLYEQANLAYRKEFYDRIIVGLGYGAGALVSMRIWDDFQGSSIALVSDLDPMSVGLGNLTTGYWNEFHTALKTSVLWEGQKRTYSSHSKLFNFETPNPPSLREDDRIGSVYFSGANADYWSQGWIESIVSPAPQTMSEEWFNGQSEPIDYVMKKRTASDLWNTFRYSIMAYYPHSNKDRKINAFKRSIGLPV